MRPQLLPWTCLVASATFSAANAAHNATHINPMISGWASDPSCVHVKGTFFCALSTFIAFPGLPIYASRDLVNWKLVSHAWNRDAQLPDNSKGTANQQGGMYAPNLRYHDGVFHCTCTYLSDNQLLGTIFKTSDPFSNAAWSDPVTFDSPSIDPDIFWDDDGQAYLTTAGIQQQKIDVVTGNVTQPAYIWNGTGGASPEGPHIYKKDGYYYLMIAEGGTELGHSEVIARSRNISGPYQAYENNPILSNANTTEYFQTVGHADLFQDGNGNWWSSALSTRSGPDWKVYPMGREAVLTAVTWESGKWPVFSPVRGIENTWSLPRWNRDVPGKGAFNDDPDVVEFAPGSTIPSHFYYWRYPVPGTFAVSPKGHPRTLRVTPLRANLTGDWTDHGNDTSLTGLSGIPFVGRRQTDTLFKFGVDISFSPKRIGSEAGISVFLTQFDHIDLAITKRNGPSSPEIIFRQYSTPTWSAQANYTNFTSTETVQPVPTFWLDKEDVVPRLRLGVWTVNATHYGFSVAPADDPNSRIIVGYSEAERVSGRSGRFTGTLLGVYNTCNGAVGVGVKCSHGEDAYFSRWRYTPVAQYVDFDELVPVVL